jgi:hypothetical protein
VGKAGRSIEATAARSVHSCTKRRVSVVMVPHPFALVGQFRRVFRRSASLRALAGTARLRAYPARNQASVDAPVCVLAFCRARARGARFGFRRHGRTPHRDRCDEERTQLSDSSSHRCHVLYPFGSRNRHHATA